MEVVFNVNKCKVMSFTRAGNYQFEYNLNNGILKYVSYFNDLGLIVTDKLSWKMHNRSVVSKGNKMLGLIKCTLGPNAPVKSKVLLYNSLVSSVREHRSIIWNPVKSDMMLLKGIQRRATKFINIFIK